MSQKKSNTIQKLQTKLTKLKKELRHTRLDIKTGQIDNTNAHKPLKKQIAQLKTKLTQLQLNK